MLCTASFTNGVPRWLTGKGKGWVTAEYAMLPRATHTRSPREAAKGKQSGRTLEIQRLIGRSLRAVTDLAAMGEDDGPADEQAQSRVLGGTALVDGVEPVKDIGPFIFRNAGPTVFNDDFEFLTLQY